MIKETKYLSVQKSKVNGVGLFVNENLKKGEIIAHIKGDKVLIRHFTPQISKKSVNWIGASRHTWIITDDSLFRFINHSCEPNVAIKGERTVYALRNLQAGEEIMMDYSLTETEKDWYLYPCNCRTATCRTKIGPIDSLSAADFKIKRHLVTQPFLRFYKHAKLKSS